MRCQAGELRGEATGGVLDYLDMQGRSSSEEAAFDDDASDYSSSGNDSDIVRAISADILRKGESIRCLGLQPASAPQTA